MSNTAVKSQAELYAEVREAREQQTMLAELEDGEIPGVKAKRIITPNEFGSFGYPLEPFRVFVFDDDTVCVEPDHRTCETFRTLTECMDTLFTQVSNVLARLRALTIDAPIPQKHAQ